MKIRKLLAVPLLALALAGCIKDDLSDCRPEKNVILHFRYNSADGMRLNDYIGSADLFLFDSKGKYLLYRSAETDELASDDPQMALTLDPGTYYVLSWGNVEDNSAYQNLTPGVTTLEECLVEIDPVSTRTGDPVYYAPRKPREDVKDPRLVMDMNIYELVVPTRGSVEKTLEFVRAHRSIYVWVRGFQDAGQNPTVEAKGLWSRYDFRYCTHDYRRNFVQQTSDLTMENQAYACATFHHAYGVIDDDMNVLVSRTSNGELSATVNVRQFLEENPTSSTDDIHIMLTFIQDLGVKVTLPQWIVKPVHPGID